MRTAGHLADTCFTFGPNSENVTKLENVDEPRQNWDDSRLPNLLLNCTNGTHKLGTLGKWRDCPHQTKFVTGSSPLFSGDS